MLHVDRWNPVPVTFLRKNGVVIHTSEGGETRPQQLIDALATPGDRDNGKGGKYGAGYHAVAVGSGYVQVANETMGPFAAPPLNATWWHICIPGTATQTRDQWLDETSLGYLHGVAQFIVDKARVDGFIPARLTVPQLVAGGKGYCSHKDVSDGWHKTDHFDPGPNFPWDVLGDLLDDILMPIPDPTPPEEPDMPASDTAITWTGFIQETNRPETRAFLTFNANGAHMTGCSDDSAFHFFAEAFDIPLKVEDVAAFLYADLLGKAMRSMGFAVSEIKSILGAV